MAKPEAKFVLRDDKLTVARAKYAGKSEPPTPFWIIYKDKMMFSLSFFSAIKQSHLRKVLFAFFPPSLWAGRVEAHDRTKIVLSRVGGSSRYLLFPNFLSFSHRPILVPMLRIYCICSIFCAHT